MMNYIWAGIMVISVACALATGKGNEITQAMFSGAQDAVTLVIALLGAMCLWSGLMRVADKAGITKGLSKLFRPVLKRLFPGLPTDSPAARAMSMNISANLLGMGNAATPFGIAAMKELAKGNLRPGVADDHMITFVVLNTASLQLIPSTIAVIRSTYGSMTPFDIMPAIWITSLASLVVGLLATRILRRRVK